DMEYLTHEPIKPLPPDLAPAITKEKDEFRLTDDPQLLGDRATTFLPIAPHSREPTERDTVGHNDEPIPAKATRQASVGRRAANRQHKIQGIEDPGDKPLVWPEIPRNVAAVHDGSEDHILRIGAPGQENGKRRTDHR